LLFGCDCREGDSTDINYTLKNKGSVGAELGVPIEKANCLEVTVCQLIVDKIGNVLNVGVFNCMATPFSPNISILSQINDISSTFFTVVDWSLLAVVVVIKDSDIARN
jgi:hypothetical protein